MQNTKVPCSLRMTNEASNHPLLTLLVVPVISRPCPGGKPRTVIIFRSSPEDSSCTGRKGHLTWRKIDF